MKLILAYHTVIPSARVLARKLGDDWRVTTNPEKNFLIRWGNSSYKKVEDTFLNDPELISVGSGKLSFSNFLSQHEIPHVKINKGVPEKFPVVVRKNLYGMRGQGIVICRTEQDWFPYKDFHWSYWYKFEFELGVHILGGEIVKIFKKYSTRNEDEFPIRNLVNGYHFGLVSPNSFPKLYPTVNALYEKFPIKFGRLDIGWDGENKVYRIIEINSAPGLTENENTLNLYANYIKKELGE